MNFARAIAKLFPPTEAPPERKARTLPPNIGHGDSHLDSLWYYLIREAYRALVRSLVEKELADLGTLSSAAGHSHNESQAGAMDWWQIGSFSPWTSAGPASGGPLVIDSTTEQDLFFTPIVVPDGVSRIYPKVKVSTTNLGYRLELRLRIFSPGSLNSTTPISGGQLGVSDYGGLLLQDRSWMSFDPVDITALPVTSGVRLGLGLWSAYVGAGGQVGYLWQTSYGLRPGH